MHTPTTLATIDLSHMPPETQKVGHRSDIDGLRAVAVVAVIVNHFNNNLLPGGYLGVDIFFVISGYVITASMTAGKNTGYRQFLIEFYTRRMKRLLPALIVCVGFTALMGAFFIAPNTAAFRNSMRAGLYALVGLSNMDFYSHATDYFAASTQLNLFTHTWSLGVEEQFYVIFPTLFWLLLRSRTSSPSRSVGVAIAFGLLLIGSWANYVWLRHINSPGSYFLMPPRLWELGLGSATYMCIDHRVVYKARSLVVWGAVVAVAIALSLEPTWQVLSTTTVALATAGLIHSLRSKQLIHRLLCLRPVQFIGVISYSLYLWHWSVLVLSRWTIGVSWNTAPLELALILALSYATWLTVERPLRHAQWSTKYLLTIAYGAAGILSAAGFLQLLIHPLGRVLYAGEPARLAEAGAASLLNDRLSEGRLIWPARQCVLESEHDVNRRISPDTCTFGADGSGTTHFLVIGNSFSAAEFEMYSTLTEREQGVVTATSSWGASAVPEIQNRSPWAGTNDHYWKDVVPILVKTLRQGDVLVMLNDLSDITPEHLPMNDDGYDDLRRLERGLSRISKEMRERGVAIVFQTAIPFMRDAHCAPDMAKRQWFNMGDQHLCSYQTRTATLARRKPLDEVLQRVRTANPNFHVLDLMPVMCPGPTCTMTTDDGVFLYRDEWSHPSVEANRLAQPVFLAVIHRALSSFQHTTASAELR